MLKKILATILALVMVLGVFAINTSAAEVEDVVYGDLDGDNKVNSNDALKVLQIATGLAKAEGFQKAIADTNADGKVNSTDALFILQKSTGLVQTFGKSYDKTLKATKVDPVFDSGAFTFQMRMKDESVGDFDMVFSTDGSAKVIATVVMFVGVLPIEVRMLHLDGKNYQVVPTVNYGLEKAEGAYCEIDDDIAQLFDNYVLLFTTDVVYGSTTKKTVNGDTYDCETFYNKNGAVFEFCYLNGALELLVVSNNGTTQTLDVSNLEKGADTTRLVIPEDCKYDETLGQDK